MSDPASRSAREARTEAERPTVLFFLDHGRGPVSGRTDDPVADLPYSYGLCAEFFDVRTSASHPEHRLVREIRRAVKLVIGFDLVHAVRNRAALRQTDYVVTHTEHEHLALALLRKLRVFDAPIMGQSIWLWDRWASFGPLRRAVHRWLLQEVDLLTVHSPTNAVTGTAAIGRRVWIVPFGASPQIDLPDRDPEHDGRIRVVAPGSDRHRDWPALVETARTHDDLDVTIISRRARARWAARKGRGRVRVVRTEGSAPARRIMAAHDVVVVPLRRNQHASGLTVLYEGFSIERPVAATRTGGLDFYGREWVDWASPGDVDSLYRAIRDAAGRASDTRRLEDAWDSVARRGLTSADFGLRHVIGIWHLQGRPVDLPLLETESPIAPLVRGLAESLEGAAPVARGGVSGRTRRVRRRP